MKIKKHASFFHHTNISKLFGYLISDRKICALDFERTHRRTYTATHDISVFWLETTKFEHIAILNWFRSENSEKITFKYPVSHIIYSNWVNLLIHKDAGWYSCLNIHTNMQDRQESNLYLNFHNYVSLQIRTGN